MHSRSYSSGLITISLSTPPLQSLMNKLNWKVSHFMMKSPSQPIRLILRLSLVLNSTVQLRQMSLVPISRELVKETRHLPSSRLAQPCIGGNRPLISDGYTTCSELKQFSSCRVMRLLRQKKTNRPNATSKYTPVRMIQTSRLSLSLETRVQSCWHFRAWGRSGAGFRGYSGRGDSGRGCSVRGDQGRGHSGSSRAMGYQTCCIIIMACSQLQWGEVAAAEPIKDRIKITHPIYVIATLQLQPQILYHLNIGQSSPQFLIINTLRPISMSSVPLLRQIHTQTLAKNLHEHCMDICLADITTDAKFSEDQTRCLRNCGAKIVGYMKVAKSVGFPVA